MTSHELSGPGYYNQHPYNNKESRWCDLNEVPYARNGYLYGPETIEDQMTGQIYYHLNMHKSYANLYTAMVENTIDPTVFFKEGDSLLIRYRQADVRFTVTGFSSRAKNMVGTRHLNVAWHWDEEGWNVYKRKHLGNDPSNQKKLTHWKVWQDKNAFWTTGSVKTNTQHDKIARFWNWQAVPKEVFLKFQLLGFA
jgi:hypothetical protein